MDHASRKWLIDTGSKNNYISPRIIPKGVETQKENFTIKTATGEKKGTDVIYTYCLENFLRNPKVIKFYVYDFSPNYDILLGNETMDEMETQINFKERVIKTKYTEFKFRLHEDENVKTIPIRKGTNIIPLPKKGLYVVNLESEKVNIPEGLYENNVIAISNEDIEEFELNFKELLGEEVEIKDFIENNNNNSQKDVIKEIPRIIRSDHMSEKD